MPVPDEVFPPICELLPHRGRAVLLERVLRHDGTTTVCAVDPEAGSLFRNPDGSTPSYVGLEYMAQAVAAHGSLVERARAAADPAVHAHARPGFFVGTRRLTLSCERFEAGQFLTVTATHLRGTAGLLAFDCAVQLAADAAAPGIAANTTTMVSGVLTVYLLESFEALVEDFSRND